MKILSSKQMHEADAYTIEHEPVSSIDLMERAATRLFEYISKTYPNKTEFCVFCGKTAGKSHSSTDTGKNEYHQGSAL